MTTPWHSSTKSLIKIYPRDPPHIQKNKQEKGKTKRKRENWEVRKACFRSSNVILSKPVFEWQELFSFNATIQKNFRREISPPAETNLDLTPPH